MKRTKRQKNKEPIRPPSPDSSTADWSKTNGGYIAGRAHADGTDELAEAMETKWGRGRLRLLVETEWREKFDRQRYKYASALWAGDLEALKAEAARMQAAYRKLDQLADAAGKTPASPDYAEVVLDDGTVAAIAITDAAGKFKQDTDRNVVIYTLEEIGRLLSQWPEIARVKEHFPGAAVTKVSRQAPADPLDAISDKYEPLDEIPF